MKVKRFLEFLLYTMLLACCIAFYTGLIWFMFELYKMSISVGG